MLLSKQTTLLENKRICAACNTCITSQWHRHDGLWLCRKCYDYYVWRPTRDGNRIIFCRRNRLIEYNPRKGKCNECHRKIGDKYTNHFGKQVRLKRTHMHHWFYLVIMPWACTEELCIPCHRKYDINSGRPRKNIGAL